MSPVLLLFAIQGMPAAGPQSAVEAEAAFAADAQAIGQWSAFRKWAARDAVLFDPAPTPIAKALGDAPDPPASVRWWPVESWTACDGQSAVNRGGSVWPDGGGGWFTTLWQRQGTSGPWRWRIDGGDRTRAVPTRPATVTERRASCAGTPPALSRGYPEGEGGGGSSDRTLRWHWRVAADGERWFSAETWTGTRYRTVMTDHVAAPKQPAAPASRPAPGE